MILYRCVHVCNYRTYPFDWCTQHSYTCPRKVGPAWPPGHYRLWEIEKYFIFGSLSGSDLYVCTYWAQSHYCWDLPFRCHEYLLTGKIFWTRRREKYSHLILKGGELKHKMSSIPLLNQFNDRGELGLNFEIEKNCEWSSIRLINGVIWRFSDNAAQKLVKTSFLPLLLHWLMSEARQPG